MVRSFARLYIIDGIYFKHLKYYVCPYCITKRTVLLKGKNLWTRSQLNSIENKHILKSLLVRPINNDVLLADFGRRSALYQIINTA